MIYFASLDYRDRKRKRAKSMSSPATDPPKASKTNLNFIIANFDYAALARQFSSFFSQHADNAVLGGDAGGMRHESTPRPTA